MKKINKSHSKFYSLQARTYAQKLGVMRYDKEDFSEYASFITSKHGKFKNDKIAIKSLANLSSVSSLSGFTLIELLVVIGVIAILAAVVLVAVNPGRQFAQARDTQRRSDLYSMTNAIYQYSVEHNGELPDTDGNLATNNFPTAPACVGSGGGCFNLGGAGDDGDTVSPTYIAEMPVDPSSGTDADTGYVIFEENGRVVASASGEIAETITITR